MDEGGRSSPPECPRRATPRSARRAAGRAEFLASLAPPYVVKTDGLAEGKGVLVTESLADAEDAVRAYLSGEAFGDAGRTLVIEEGMTGPELSLLVVCNGDPARRAPARALAGLQAHRGGRHRPEHRRHGRVLAGAGGAAAGRRRADGRPRSCRRSSTLAAQGIDYRGVLYAGMMLTPTAPRSSSTTCASATPRRRRCCRGSRADVAELIHTPRPASGPLDARVRRRRVRHGGARHRGLSDVAAHRRRHRGARRRCWGSR